MCNLQHTVFSVCFHHLYKALRDSKRTVVPNNFMFNAVCYSLILLEGRTGDQSSGDSSHSQRVSDNRMIHVLAKVMLYSKANSAEGHQCYSQY